MLGQLEEGWKMEERAMVGELEQTFYSFFHEYTPTPWSGSVPVTRPRWRQGSPRNVQHSISNSRQTNNAQTQGPPALVCQ